MKNKRKIENQTASRKFHLQPPCTFGSRLERVSQLSPSNYYFILSGSTIKKASTMFGYILQEAFGRLDVVIKGNTITFKFKLLFSLRIKRAHVTRIASKVPVVCLFLGTWSTGRSIGFLSQDNGSLSNLIPVSY